MNVRTVSVLLGLVLILFGCNSAENEPIATEPVIVPTAELSQIFPSPQPTITATMLPTLTSAPEPTPLPPSTATPIPSITPSSTPSPTATPTATYTPVPTPTSVIDRSCPIIPHPTYRRFWLDAQPWPTPNDAPQEHLWLGKPLPPGAGRLLINENFPYGWDANRLLLHNGVDVGVDLGTPVLSVADGVVVYAGDDLTERFGWRCDWYGQFVAVRHDANWLGQPVFSLFGHVLNINVETGDRVTRGEQVAEVGFGGAAKAWHLHFEVRVGDNDFFNSRNPLLWLQPGEGRGVLAGRLVDPRGHSWQGVPIFVIPDDKELNQRQTWTYLGDDDNVAIPDEHLAENFVVGDLKAGSYKLFTTIQGVEYRAEVEIRPNQINSVEIITAPLKQTTPTAP